MNLKKYFGPSTLIAAAFIGPGTVTVCTMAGQQAGYVLLWALLFSLLATYVLQEMCGRLGLITQAGLGEAIISGIPKPVIQRLLMVLVFVAIVLGNAAYEAGNISGAYLGIQTLAGDWQMELFGFQLKLIPLLIGITAFVLMLTQSIKIITRFLIALVVLMSMVFLLTLMMVKADFTAILKGLFIPQVPVGQWMLVLALIGTTVVPYNLFLHTASVSKKWKSVTDLADLRIETLVAIVLGGLVSVSIVITAAAAGQGRGIANLADMAVQLEPLLGSWAKYFLAGGLFAAGLSSAITAPLAAAYAMHGMVHQSKAQIFRLSWMAVIIIGTFFASIGYHPLAVIKLAQVANGLLLPLIAAVLLYLMNKKVLLNKFTNTTRQNVVGSLVILLCLLMSFRLFWSIFT